MKLSDALRGAADRAPLDGLAVDAAGVQRRVTAQRGLRHGASGVLAGGMVAVLGFGVSGAIGGAAGMSLAESDASARDEGSVTTEGALGGAGADGAIAGSSLAWGLCGEPLPVLDSAGAPVALTVTLPSDSVEGGELPVTVTTAVLEGGTFETFGLGGVILWDGLVVGTVGTGTPAEAMLVDLASGTETVEDLQVPLVNCWDGEPLPAAKYELVVAQELWAVIAEEPPVAEEPTEPGDPGSPAEPTAAPASGESGVGGEVTDPDTSVSSDGTVSSDDADDAASSGGVSAPGSGIAAGGPSARAIAPAVAFVIDGPAVEDPFGGYLGGGDPGLEPEPIPEPLPPTDPPVLDEDALTPDTARTLYRDGLAGTWDMAAGSQRWIVSSDSTGTLGSAWFGCAWDGDGAFPAQSARMDLLDVAVAAPPTLSVSYGWVVDGNPTVRTRVTNTSPWNLAGFWDPAAVQLALVRDGRVVAEAYPVSPYQHGGIGIAEAGGATADMAIEPAMPATGGLAAGETASAELLWRDVNGCWTDAGATTVEPGAYTLLALQYVSVGGGMVVWSEDAGDVAFGGEPRTLDLGDAERDEAGVAVTGGGTSGSTGRDEPMPAPDQGVWDAVDFQVWTSLGTITVR